MPFNDEIESGDFEYELVLSDPPSTFTPRWPTLQFRHQTAVKFTPIYNETAPSWLRAFLGEVKGFQLELNPELWFDISPQLDVEIHMKALPDTRSFVEILLSPLRPGEPERRLLVVDSGSIDLLTSKLLLCQYGSGLAIATSSGDVLVSLVNAWRDEDEARGKIAGIRLHVGGNHAEVDAAILLLSVVAMSDSQFQLTNPVVGYQELGDWFNSQTRSDDSD